MVAQTNKDVGKSNEKKRDYACISLGSAYEVWKSLGRDEKIRLVKFFREVIVSYKRLGRFLPISVEGFKEIIDLLTKSLEGYKFKVEELEKRVSELSEELKESENELRSCRDANEGLQKALAQQSSELQMCKKALEEARKQAAKFESLSKLRLVICLYWQRLPEDVRSEILKRVGDVCS